jgi:predicted nucleic acid-binding protein
LSVVFVDTSAILALFNPKDECHRRALNAFASC